MCLGAVGGKECKVKMKKIKIIILICFLLGSIGCASSDISKNQFLIMGTIKDEDYKIIKDQLSAKVFFYPQDIIFEELSIIVEDIDNMQIVSKIVFLKEDFIEENLIEIYTKNIGEQFGISIGLNGKFKELTIDIKCDYMFAYSYNASQNGKAAFDLMQYLEYREVVSNEVELFSMKLFPLNKEYLVKLIVS